MSYRYNHTEVSGKTMHSRAFAAGLSFDDGVCKNWTLNLLEYGV